MPRLEVGSEVLIGRIGMNADAAYLDTCALAKWYLPEPGSEAFGDFIARRAAPSSAA